MNIKTLEELDRQLKSDEEMLIYSLKEYKNAKASLKKARITSVYNKLLAPYRRFKIEQSIARYDAMIERLEKKREKEVNKAIKLQEKEQELERRRAKSDFKAAIRTKQKEDIINFGKEIASEVSDIFSDIRDMGKGKVKSASCLVITTKNAFINKIKSNTMIDAVISNSIDNLKLKQATYGYNNALKKQEEQKERIRLDEINKAIRLDEEKISDYRNRDVPFSNINQKISKVSKQSSYMGRATNKVVAYFRRNYDKISTKIKEDFREDLVNTTFNIYIVRGKVAENRCKMMTFFNNKIADAKENFDEKIESYKKTLDIKKAEKLQKKEEEEYLKNRKKDIIAVLREEEERKRAIKKAQIESIKQATEAINNDIFANAISVNDLGNVKSM